MASVNSFETDMRKLRRKRKRKRAFKHVISMLVVVAVILTVYLSRGLWLPSLEGILERNYSKGDSVQQERFPIDISKKSNVLIDTMGDCWIMYANTSLSVCNSDGDELNNVYLPYTNPVVETTDKRALVYDMGGYNLCVVSRRNTAFSKKLEEQILFAELGPKGNVAVVTSTDKYPAYLTVYDKNGTEVFHWADGNLITSIDLDDSGNKAIVSSIYASGGAFKTIVSVLDISKGRVVSKTSATETLCLELKYTSRDGFWVIGDNALYRFNKDCGIEYSYSYGYDISGYAVSENSCAVMFKAVDTGASYVSMFSALSDDAAETSFSEKISGIRIFNNDIYICSQSRLNAYDTSGRLVATLPLDTEYNSFTVCSDDVFFAGYRSIDKQSLNSND